MTNNDSNTWLAAAGSLTWRWLRTLLRTILIFGVAGLVVGPVCGAIAADGWGLRVSIALLVLAVFIVVAVGFGMQRALAEAVTDGVRRFGLSRRLVQRVLQYLQLDETDDQGTRPKVKIPLAQAEAGIRAALRMLDDRNAGRNWLVRFVMRQIHHRLIREIEFLVLMEIRQRATGSNEPEIDSTLIRGYLATKLDDKIEDHLVGSARKLMRLWLIVLIVGLPAVAYASRYSSKWLPKS